MPGVLLAWPMVDRTAQPVGSTRCLRLQAPPNPIPLGLPSPAADPDYCEVYGQLAALRLPAANMDVAWLNDKNLRLRPEQDSCCGWVVELRDVRWLDLVGSIPGVCAWGGGVQVQACSTAPV